MSNRMYLLNLHNKDCNRDHRDCRGHSRVGMVRSQGDMGCIQEGRYMGYVGFQKAVV